jgi:hypothetical protein
MNDKLSDLQQWYQQLQRVLSNQEIIEDIERRKTKESDPEILRSLDFILASEFQRQGLYSDAENILLELSRRDTTEPYPLIALAEQKLYYERKFDSALDIADEAVRCARISGKFRRNALGVRARIAKQLQRYDLIAEALREIMSIKFSESRIDVGVERDFVDGLPSNAIEEQLRRQYEQFFQNATAG